MEGKFITVEGIDGSGKTLAVDTISEKLAVNVTREPSTFWTGDVLRHALQEETAPFTDFFLFMADRSDHIEYEIVPQLENGVNVISDRFSDSTYAYQAIRLNNHLDEPMDWMTDVMEPWCIVPDKTIYLDVSVETALERCAEDEKYETKQMLEQVKTNYEYLLENDKDRFIRINAEQSKEEVEEEVLSKVENTLET